MAMHWLHRDGSARPCVVRKQHGVGQCILGYGGVGGGAGEFWAWYFKVRSSHCSRCPCSRLWHACASWGRCKGMKYQQPLTAFSLHPAVFFSLQSLCLMHTGKPTGVAVPHCITWFQTQLIPTTCQIRYHSHLWDYRSTGQL